MDDNNELSGSENMPSEDFTDSSDSVENYTPAQFPEAAYTPPMQPPYFNGNPPPYGQPIMPPQELPGKQLGTAGLVLGILSIVMNCLYIGILFGIPGLIVSVLSMKAAKNAGMKNSMALAGLILSILGIAFFILGLISLAVMAAMGFDYASLAEEFPAITQPAG